MSDNTPQTEADKKSQDDLWGEAMSEQHSQGGLAAKDNLTVGFPEDMNLILDIPVKMTVELGRTKMTIKELLRLSQGSVVALEVWQASRWISLSLIHISEPTRLSLVSRMPSSA